MLVHSVMMDAQISRNAEIWKLLPVTTSYSIDLSSNMRSTDYWKLPKIAFGNYINNMQFAVHKHVGEFIVAWNYRHIQNVFVTYTKT